MKFKNVKELRDEIFKELDNSTYQYHGELYYWEKNSGKKPISTGYIPSHVFWIEDYYDEFEFDTEHMIDYLQNTIYDKCIKGNDVDWNAYVSKYKLAINTLITNCENTL